MTHADLAGARDLLLGDGWPDRTPFFAFAVDHPECRAIVAELDGVVVGTGVGTRNGRAGWVGLIFVAPSLRERGLGGAITTAVCADLEDRGCRTLLLLASRLGEPVYRRLGFEAPTSYRVYEPPETGVQPTDPFPGARIRLLEASDVAAVEALDRRATGEDRSHLIRAVLSDGGRVVVGPDGAVRAFELDPAWGGHPLIAPDPADAYALLVAGAADGPFRRRAVVPDENAPAIAVLESHGWQHTRSLTRMLRGEALPWQPTWLWGNFNFAVG